MPKSGGSRSIFGYLKRLVSGVYYSLETEYYDVCDKLEQLGLPIYRSWVKPVEAHGLPSFVASAVVGLVAISLLLVAVGVQLAPQYYSIDGTVVARDGTLLSGVEVLLKSGDGVIIGRAVSAAGKVRFAGVPGGRLTLSAAGGGWAGAIYFDASRNRKPVLVLSGMASARQPAYPAPDKQLFLTCANSGGQPPCAEAEWDAASCSYRVDSCVSSSLLNLQVVLYRAGTRERIDAPAVVSIYDSFTGAEVASVQASGGVAVFKGVKNGFSGFVSVWASGFAPVARKDFGLSPQSTVVAVELAASNEMFTGVFSFNNASGVAVNASLAITALGETAFLSERPAERFSASLAPGSYAVVVSAEGYATASRAINVSNDFAALFTLEALANGSSCGVRLDSESVGAGEPAGFSVVSSDGFGVENLSGGVSCDFDVTAFNGSNYSGACAFNESGTHVIAAVLGGAACVPANVFVTPGGGNCSVAVFPESVVVGEPVQVSVLRQGLSGSGVLRAGNETVNLSCAQNDACGGVFAFEASGVLEVSAELGGVECTGGVVVVGAGLDYSQCLVTQVGSTQPGVAAWVRIDYLGLPLPPANEVIPVECAGSNVSAVNCSGTSGSCFAACTAPSEGVFPLVARVGGVECASDFVAGNASAACSVFAPETVVVGGAFDAVVLLNAVSGVPEVACGGSRVNASCVEGVCVASCVVLAEGSSVVSATVGGVGCAPATVAAAHAGVKSSCVIASSGSVVAGVSSGFTVSYFNFSGNASTQELLFDGVGVLPSSCATVGGVVSCSLAYKFPSSGSSVVVGRGCALDVNVTSISGGSGASCRVLVYPQVFEAGDAVRFYLEYDGVEPVGVASGLWNGSSFSIRGCAGVSGNCSGYAALAVGERVSAPAIISIGGADCSVQLVGVPSNLPKSACLVPDSTVAFGVPSSGKLFYFNAEPSQVSLSCGGVASVVGACGAGSCSYSCNYSEPPEKGEKVMVEAASLAGLSCKGLALASSNSREGCLVHAGLARVGVGESAPIVVSYWGFDAPSASIDCGNGSVQQASCAGGYCRASCSYESSGSRVVSAVVAGRQCGGAVVAAGGSATPFCVVSAPDEVGLGSFDVAVGGKNFGASPSLAVDCGGVAGIVGACNAVGNVTSCSASCSFSSAVGLARVAASMAGVPCARKTVGVVNRTAGLAPSCSISAVPVLVRPGESANITVSYRDVLAIPGGRIAVDCGNGNSALASGCVAGAGSCTAVCTYSSSQPQGTVALKVSEPVSCAGSLQVGAQEATLVIIVVNSDGGVVFAPSSFASGKSRVASARVRVFSKGTQGVGSAIAEADTDEDGTASFSGLSAGDTVVIRANLGVKKGEVELALSPGSHTVYLQIGREAAVIAASARDSLGDVAGADFAVFCPGLVQRVSTCVGSPYSCDLVAFAGESCRVAADAVWHLPGEVQVVPVAAAEGVPAVTAVVGLQACGGEGGSCCAAGHSLGECGVDLACDAGLCVRVAKHAACSGERCVVVAGAGV
ncbi:MAG: hypothetical protein AABW54_04520, partial [Candidatus Micrarchaeota archaeon]